MESLLIEGTKVTPQINFNAHTGKLEISGNSLPEDVVGFYAQVFEWLNKYIEKPHPITEMHIKLNYFNSASAKVIIDILTILEGVLDHNAQVQAYWHYIDIDDDMFQTGKEFQSMIKIPFLFIQHVSNE